MMLKRHIGERLRSPGSASHLAAVRVIFCLHLIIVFTSPAIPLLQQFSSVPHPLTATVFPAALEQWIRHNISWLTQLGALSACLGLLGFMTRISLWVCFAAFLLTQNFYFRGASFHDDWLYFNFFLLMLALAPSGAAWSLDSLIAAWRRRPQPKFATQIFRRPIELMIAWFALIYFAAGIAKIFPLQKGLYFLNGQTIQQFVVEFHLDSPIYALLERALFDYRIAWPFAIAGCLTAAVELAALALVLTDRWHWPVLLSLIGMHFGILLFGIPGFLQIALVSLPLFIDPKHFAGFDARYQRCCSFSR